MHSSIFCQWKRFKNRVWCVRFAVLSSLPSIYLLIYGEFFIYGTYIPVFIIRDYVAGSRGGLILWNLWLYSNSSLIVTMNVKTHILLGTPFEFMVFCRVVFMSFPRVIMYSLHRCQANTETTKTNFTAFLLVYGWLRAATRLKWAVDGWSLRSERRLRSYRGIAINVRRYE